MNSLRPLERGDLEQVAALFLRVVRPGAGDSVAETAAYFERTTIDHPWADPDIPSLVFVDDRGTIVGFIGSYVTRMRLDGDSVRAACPGNLVADPEAHAVAPGALLLREHFNGAQDVTFVDTLGEPSRAMWEALGGDTAWLGAVSWVRVFRPLRLAYARFVHPRRLRPLSFVLSPAFASFDAAARTVWPSLLRPSTPPTTARPLDPKVMAAELPRLTAAMRLYPDYDERYLAWMLAELATPRRRGRLVARLVSDGERVLGWYVYFLKPGGISRVLQIMGSEQDIGSVVDHLFHDAETGGTAALEGRIEPRLLAALARRRCILRHTAAAGIHSKNHEILAAAFSRRSVFTRMDSEYWPIPPRRL